MVKVITTVVVGAMTVVGAMIKVRIMVVMEMVLVAGIKSQVSCFCKIILSIKDFLLSFF